VNTRAPKDLVAALDRKKVPFIIIELLGITVESSQIRNVFKSFEMVTESVSCLEPVRSLLDERYKEEYFHCNFIYELIEQLQFNSRTGRSFGLHLEDDLFNGDLYLRRYSREEVTNSIIEHQRKLKTTYGITR
jgi:hypothetical protein